MTDDVEHLFMLILAIYISSLERCLFKSFAYFLIELFAIMYNFACKYSKNCRSPDLNGIGFGHVEAQSKLSVWICWPYRAWLSLNHCLPRRAGVAMVKWKRYYSTIQDVIRPAGGSAFGSYFSAWSEWGVEESVVFGIFRTDDSLGYNLWCQSYQSTHTSLDLSIWL